MQLKYLFAEDGKEMALKCGMEMRHQKQNFYVSSVNDAPS
jgi:hypothetical protein